ncbi:MAG: hypothetical protein WC792_06550 [Candidatus Micrarchaeia archaeon]|jgi:hypothetical protein
MSHYAQNQSRAPKTETSYRMLAGLLIVSGVVELLDFLGYLNGFSDGGIVATLAMTLGLSFAAAYQRLFFLALFTGILGGTSLWLGLRIKKHALSTITTVEETRTALAYTTVGLFSYSLYYASQSAFFPNTEPLVMLAGVYAAIAFLVLHWAR